jgi:hypothetical protein
MPQAWNGPDPSEAADPPSQFYELGTRFIALGDITITKIRIWAGPTSNLLPGHKGRVWSLAGAELASVVLPDTLSAGWTEHALATPVPVTLGTQFVISYGVQEHYAARGGNYPVPSIDALVTAQLGQFAGTLDIYPANTSNSFYGADFVYTSGVAANDAPVGTLAIAATGLTATATVGIVDEIPAGVTVRLEWGDGTFTTASGPGAYAHTYAAAGTYAVLLLLTDPAGAYDALAAPVTALAVVAPPPNATELNVLRMNTLAFIAANPVLVTLIPRTRQLTGSGSRWIEGTPRAPQVARLIDTQAVGGLSSGTVQAVDGSQIKNNFQLLLPYDGVVGPNDYWESGGIRYEVLERINYNGYEQRAAVVAL